MTDAGTKPAWEHLAEVERVLHELVDSETLTPETAEHLLWLATGINTAAFREGHAEMIRAVAARRDLANVQAGPRDNVHSPSYSLGAADAYSQVFDRLVKGEWT